MNVFHLSRDLMLGAKVSSAARSAGTPFQSAPNTDKLIRALQQHFSTDGAGEPAVRVLVDLQIPGLDIGDLKIQLDELPSSVEVVAYAQHVMTELIAVAKESGIGVVMTRGQFDNKVNDLVG